MIELATEADVPELTAVHNAVGADLTARFGKGPWTRATKERGVLLSFRHARVLVARERGKIVGALRLATKKPWAIDLKYFTPVPRAIYLLDMAIAPHRQGHGVGRKLLKAAERTSREWPAQSIRLDAYDRLGGAGGFYLRCGYREMGQVAYRGTPLRYFERLIGDE